MSPASPAAVKPMVDQTGLSGNWLQFSAETNDNFIRPIALGPDGNIWFGAVSASGAPELGRMTGTGSVSYFPTENGTGVITAVIGGPDDDVWFTSLGGNTNTWKLGKMTTDGRVIFNETLPHSVGAATSSIAVGGDGDVWFPVGGGSGDWAIAKSTPGGRVTTYTCSFCDMGASGVTRGVDGNIWFTYSYGTAFGVAKITSDGTMTSYPAPANELVEYRPVLGHDGRIWFSVLFEKSTTIIYQIGAIDVNGAMTFYALPEQGYPGASGLAAGPDGRVWYTQRRHIGRVDTSGVFSLPFYEPMPLGGDTIELLAFGIDDNAWFTSGLANAIGVYVWSKMTVVPSTLGLTVGGGAQTLDVHEPTYTHTWTAVSWDPTIATVSPLGRHQFSVTPVAVGSCKIVVSDDRTNSVSIPVTVH